MADRSLRRPSDYSPTREIRRFAHRVLPFLRGLQDFEFYVHVLCLTFTANVHTRTEQCRRCATVFAPALRHRPPPPAARPPAHLTHLTRAPHARAQGEHLLHVLNTISSRKLVLEAELKEIDEDIASNESMSRKYGAEFFTEGAARLAQSRVRACESLSARRLPNVDGWVCESAGRKATEARRDQAAAG